MIDRTKVLVLVAFAAVLGVPFVFALTREGTVSPADAERLVVITPHNEQIRYEFERAFSDWHDREYGSPVDIDWRTPGGTSEIRKQLQSIYTKALKDGTITPGGELASGAPTLPNDVLFGGGSYEHGQMKDGVSVELGTGEDRRSVQLAISTPADFSQSELDAIFGENSVGSGQLYEPEGYWIGTALSGFGIVYNRDVLAELGLDEPRSWKDLTEFGYVGWLALADPRMSGSVTTTYDSILNIYGWDEGWRILRDMCANARYFAHASTQIPIDVSRGEAAAGVAIDFYGRYQSQAFMQEGETAAEARVGYSYPIEELDSGEVVGAVHIDADPVSKLRAGPNPEIADRYIAWLVSEEAQAIWQYEAVGAGPREEAVVPGSEVEPGMVREVELGWGPERFELRRLPVRRDMYTSERMAMFVDSDVNPFELARPIPYRGWRSAIAPMMAAFAVENQNALRRAWVALNEVRVAADTRPDDAELAATLAEMEEAFYAMPVHRFPDDLTNEDGSAHPLGGEELPFNPENYRTIRAADWPNRQPSARGRIMYHRFFLTQYERVVELAKGALGETS